MTKSTAASLHTPPMHTSTPAARDPGADAALHSLLLLCARNRLDDAGTAELRSLAAGIADWEAVLPAAAEHSLVPLLCPHLEESAGDVLPPLWRERFREALVANVRRNLFLTAELFRLLAAFRERGIPAIPHKGPVLAAQIYGDVAMRQFADLDFVLPQRHIPAAHEIFLKLGYRSEIRWAAGPDPAKVPGHYLYTDSSDRINAELHSELTLRYFPAPLDLEALLSRLERVEVCGQLVETFAAEDVLPLLCVHGAKHLWARLAWLGDIHALVQIRRGFDWPRALESARSLGATRMLLLGLAVSRNLMRTPLPDAVLREMREDRAVQELAQSIREQVGSESPPRPGALRRFRMRARMRGKSWDGLLYALRLATSPTEEDWDGLPLPAALSPLYSVLRPLRMLRAR